LPKTTVAAAIVSTAAPESSTIISQDRSMMDPIGAFKLNRVEPVFNCQKPARELLGGMVIM